VYLSNGEASQLGFEIYVCKYDHEQHIVFWRKWQENFMSY